MGSQGADNVPKAGKLRPALAIALIAIAAAIFIGYYIVNAAVVVNGKEISFTDDTDINTQLSEELYENGYVFTDPEMEKACVTYNFDLSDVEDGNFLLSCLQHKNYDVDFEVEIDGEKLAAYIDEWNETAEKSRNATIDENWKITEEVQGTKINKKALLADVTSESRGIDPSDYYKEPTVTADTLKKAKKLGKKYRNWTCTYDNGDIIEVPKDAVSISKTGEVTTDDSFLTEEVETIRADYDTVGEPVSFTTHAGDTIEVSSGYWGKRMNTSTELAFLKESFASGKSVKNRTPELTGTGGKIGNTYIEVSISDQHVWFVKKGKVVMESDCVTGNAGNHDTPKGIYYILERTPGKYLTGDDYETWVNQWMRVTWTGVGLHDAYWRGSFGGTIYKGNGSHGCVNLPSSFAKKLYEVTYIGLPVCIY